MATFSLSMPKFSGETAYAFASFCADFELFSSAQAWNSDQKLLFFPLCLEGAAKRAFDGLTKAQKGDLAAAQRELKQCFVAPSSVAHHLKLSALKFVPGSGQSFDLFLIELKSEVSGAFPNCPSDALLFNYFLGALPRNYQMEIVSSGISQFNVAVEKVRNMLCAEQLDRGQPAAGRVAAVADANNQLLEQILQRLDKLESAYRAPQSMEGPRRSNIQCFACARFGHVRADCRYRSAVCRDCGQTGHLAAACRQGNGGRGAAGAPRLRSDQRQHGPAQPPQ